MKKKKRRKKSDFEKLKKKAWKIYSQYIRIMSANPNGIAMCVTCGVKKHWKKMQAGHFVSGRSGRVLYADKNAHVQCYRCNVCLSSNWEAYYEFMKKTYGMDTINALLALKHEDMSNPLSNENIKAICEEVINRYGGGNEERKK